VAITGTASSMQDGEISHPYPYQKLFFIYSPDLMILGSREFIFVG